MYRGNGKRKHNSDVSSTRSGITEFRFEIDDQIKSIANSYKPHQSDSDEILILNDTPEPVKRRPSNVISPPKATPPPPPAVQPISVLRESPKSTESADMSAKPAKKKVTTSLYNIFDHSKKPAVPSKPPKEKNYNKAAMAATYGLKLQKLASVSKDENGSFSSKTIDMESKTYPGFQCASGALDNNKPFQHVVPNYKGDPKPTTSNQKPTPKALPTASPEASTSKSTDPNDLKNHESLKHFEGHLIDHIQAEILLTTNNVTWDAVAGLEQAKKTLREIVVWPFLRQDLFRGIRAPSKGVLLFGPPGTGKTMIARCVAHQAKATFFNVSVSTMTSKWVGEGEKLVRALFQIARLKLPSIIFIDEIDSLLSARKDGEHESSRRMKTEFLIQMDGIATSSDERLLILGATNKPEEIDEAARRRFPKRLYIALPETNARQLMIEKLLATERHSLTKREFEKLGEMTVGFSGADIYNFVKEAAFCPLREVMDEIETIPEENIRPVSFSDFKLVLSTVKPTVLTSELESYLEWDRQFGCHSAL